MVIVCKGCNFTYVTVVSGATAVSHVQKGSRWNRNTGAIRSRGQILHRIPASAARCSDHSGELSQPDHTGNHPTPGNVHESGLGVDTGRKLGLLSYCVFICGSFSVSEWQHHRAPAEGGLCSLRGLVHGCLHPGSWETQSCWTVRHFRLHV